MSSKTVINGIRWTLSTTLIRRVFGTVLFLFVANWLGKEDFGIFRTYSLILLFFSYLGNPGLDYHYLTDKKKDKLNLMTMLQIGVLAAIVLAFMLSIFSTQIGRLYHSVELGGILRISSAFVIIEVMRRGLRAIAQKHLLFKQLALAETLNVIVYSVLALVLIYFFRSVRLYILLFYIGNTVETLYLIVKTPKLPLRYIQRIFSIRILKLCVANIRSNLSFLVNVSLVNLIGIYSGNAPILFLGMLVSPVYLGLYFFASQLIAIPVGMLTSSISQVFFPVFAHSERDKILAGIQRYTLLVLKLGIPALIAYSFILQALIPMVLGSKWNDALPLVYYLVIFYSSSLLHHPISGVPFICRKPQWELGWNISTLALRLIALYVGMLSSFEFAIFLFCLISAVMNLLFYLMSIVLLRGDVFHFSKTLALGLVPAVVLGLGLGIFARYGHYFLGVAGLGGVYLLYLFIFDRELVHELRALLQRA